MSGYTPERWVVLEFVTPKETIQKVFAGWYGGYLDGDSWRLNSGNQAEKENVTINILDRYESK